MCPHFIYIPYIVYIFKYILLVYLNNKTQEITPKYKR